MAMDFLKNCTTNIHVVENFSQTRYSAYEWNTTDGQGLWVILQTTLTRLRKRNILCSTARNNLWIFGDQDFEPSLLDEHEQISLIESGLLGSDAFKTSKAGTLVRDILHEAIQCAVAFALAEDKRMTHIGPSTWTYAEMDREDEESGLDSLITLHAKFVRGGALYLIPEISSSSLAPLRNPTIASKIVLAPCGKVAKVLSPDDSSLVHDERWKGNLRLALRTQGIVLEDDAEWMPVQLIDINEGRAFYWPLELCFIDGSQPSARTLFADDEDWRPWFATTDDFVAFRNPLAVAEEWFQAAGERERASQTMDHATGSSTADAGHNVLQSSSEMNNTTSPAMNQRILDQQAAMAGIYPTPPDGLAQGPQLSQFNSATTPSVTQADTAFSGNDLLPTSDDSQSRAHDVNPMTGLDGYPIEQEDLFGDVGASGFEENDIGDADFNFFDDQPDSIPDLDMNESASMLEDPDQDDGKTAPALQDADGQPGIMHIESDELLAEAEGLKQRVEDENQTLINAAREAAEAPQNIDINEQPFDPPPDRRDLKLEKPLSPFGIREKLLPPPVPASVASSDSKEAERRRHSVFSPIIFRDNTNWGEKYGVDENKVNSARSNGTTAVPDISLPKTRKKSRTLSREPAPLRKGEAASESEEDSFESSSSGSELDLPPKMPWDNKKRRRHNEQEVLFPAAPSPAHISYGDPRQVAASHLSAADIVALLQQCLEPKRAGTFDDRPLSDGNETNYSPGLFRGAATIDNMSVLEDSSDVPREDLTVVAEVISQQAVTSLDFSRSPSDLLCSRVLRRSRIPPSTLQKTLRQSLEAIFHGAELYDIPRVVTNRDPLPPFRTAPAPGKAPQGQPPRLPPRADSMISAPDYFALQAPYVSIQRGPSNWEMLPSCLSFWETLGLGPANGLKNVRAFCVFPDNDDLQALVEHFLADIGTAYEGCKLGSHSHLRNVSQKDDCFEDGMAPVELEDNSVQGALRAYANTCIDLGKTLASFSHLETDRTTVVYMVNPFPGKQAVQHLCACFFQLFNAYRDNIPRSHRNQCGSDVVLQLIPISLVAAPDMFVVPDAEEMAMLAREVYDRCPPSTAAQSADNTSMLAILAAPCVELASAAPRKIGFQLAAEPPSDLLHEGSILHVAYAISKDGLWMTAVWADNTNQYQSSSSFCLRGRTFADAAEDMWERTREIIAARQVTWRVFIVTHESVDKSISHCWRSLSSRPRPQSICVTLIKIQLDPIIQLSPPALPDHITPFDAGFLTPVTTPHASHFTSSPDVTGQGSGMANAPLTPAPSDTAASIAENDPEAHLIDLADETWGLLLSSNLISRDGDDNNHALASGALFRRGEEGTDTSLSGLGVSVQWTIQVKPGGAVDEGSPKLGELTLREVLKMYRNLALLTRARGLDGGGLKGKPVPVHVVGALRGSEALEGMLRKGAWDAKQSLGRGRE